MRSKSLRHSFQGLQRVYRELNKKAVLTRDMVTFENLRKLMCQGAYGLELMTGTSKTQKRCNWQTDAVAGDDGVIAGKYARLLEAADPLSHRRLRQTNFLS